MKFTSLYAIIICFLAVATGNAQETKSENNPVVNNQETSKEKIVQQEKDALLLKVEKINSQLEKGEIDKAEADSLKNEAAEKHARNIENRLAILENANELRKRNSTDEEVDMENKSGLYIGWDPEKNDFIFKASINSKKEKKKTYDWRTSMGAHISLGMTDLVGDDNSYGNTPFSVGRSFSSEVGINLKTRVFEKTNFMRIKYGLAIQWNKLTPRGNMYLVDEAGINTLEEFPSDLRKSELRFTNLVIPVYFEFGPSKKIESKDYVRFSTSKQFKIGIGGYGGFNIETMQKLKYKEDGKRVKQKIKKDYNTTDFVYGVGAYVGYGSLSLYAKYDLSPLFKNQDVDQNLLSLGFRVDLD